jgi:hypothetical protein
VLIAAGEDAAGRLALNEYRGRMRATAQAIERLVKRWDEAVPPVLDAIRRVSTGPYDVAGESWGTAHEAARAVAVAARTALAIGPLDPPPAELLVAPAVTAIATRRMKYGPGWKASPSSPRPSGSRSSAFDIRGSFLTAPHCTGSWAAWHGRPYRGPYGWSLPTRTIPSADC